MSRAKRKQFNVEEEEEEGEESHGSYKVIAVNNTCTVKEALEQAGCVYTKESCFHPLTTVRFDGSPHQTVRTPHALLWLAPPHRQDA